ncbi:ATP-dependent DNA helicase RecG [Mesohalobacter halotolerans]|uniref:ATP-dependent DNA helicase RecG n=1 Tax=Mesohalobacter halotolerans TaxID=1883405 RepID=A0A4U5TP70_9FLAO|nr:ATP-dependent DNA helicase RecG [Mesohalobacter halotolerans]MBS3738918.1 ATP-dependent DNA helicase RecG [Psychroflexus sp.]TKS55733.1 ATP-dependent DNA helicase RecG [Mesohalobacter halotolerans]
MLDDQLKTPVVYLKGVGPQRAKLLEEEVGIKTYADLINYFPFRYVDRTQFYKIKALQNSTAEVQIVGVITEVRMLAQKRGKRLVASFEDKTGQMELVWFKRYKWIRDNLKINVPYVIYGKVKYFNGQYSMVHPEMEFLEDFKKDFSVKLQPVYSSTEKLNKSNLGSRFFNRILKQLFAELKSPFEETLPQNIIQELKLTSPSKAYFNIHFPQSNAHLAKAQFRLKWEEFFFIQLQLVRKNLFHKHKIKSYKFEQIGNFFNKFYNEILPFKLTNAQKKVLKQIRSDLGRTAHMNRLLQGDVGSGKTIVGFMSMLIAIDNGYQTCMMAPTEILAQQHYQTIAEYCEQLGVTISLLTGSSTTKQRRDIHQNLKNGSLHILVGTHALIEDKVKFHNLGFAIIDEQHRFGVAQRAKLWKKNDLPPNVLVMTATPIPRTLAMSLYGDLDISVIDELPPGRKSVKTVHRYDANRLKVFQFIKQQIAKGRQVYVVYPLIEESANFDYKDLMDGYESISREFPKPQYQISIVYGKMKPEDKAAEMQRFVNGETQIMVATTVIEVGVNIPNASVMVIESAERFGLSQLHQLRGRVGRGAEQSYCILMTSHKLSEDAKTRLQTMTQTNDGFQIAEVDLKLRGPGDLMGTQQSGLLNLKIADVVKDKSILESARHYAIRILKKDPNLENAEHQTLKEKFIRLTQHKFKWNYIS